MKEVWLIGPGNIGRHYLKVLQALDVNLTVIGRSAKKDWPVPVYEHGLDNYILQVPDSNVEYAIVAVDESQLYSITKKLIDKGIKNILIEKPAGIDKTQVKLLREASAAAKCNLFVAYNRRFYQSVQHCKEKIKESCGPISINFSFTEWIHTIPFDQYTPEELERFVLCNSSHVPDTVFYLAGKPKVLNCETAGSLDWHPAASIFQGSGITEQGVLISYNANWESAGRWSIEVCLPGEKLILRPLEKLHVQHTGSLDIIEYKLENEHIDLDYKAGLYEEVKSFLTKQNDLCTIAEQVQNFEWLYKIANYK